MNCILCKCILTLNSVINSKHFKLETCSVEQNNKNNYYKMLTCISVN